MEELEVTTPRKINDEWVEEATKVCYAKALLKGPSSINKPNSETSMTPSFNTPSKK
jgi:hypothetical protein